MTTMRQVRPRLKRFVRLMESKLADPDNQRKPDWRHESLEWLQARMLHEVSELAYAVESADPGAIAAEAADVANFAMMIADNALRMRDALDRTEGK